MPVLPSSLALTNVADGASIVAADHRNNYSAIQTDVNSLITTFGAGVTGQFLAGNGTTLSWLTPPGTELAYTEQASNAAISATTEATANTCVTASAVTFDGATLALIEFFTPVVETGTTAGDQIIVCLFEDGSSIGQWGYVRTAAALANQASMRLARRRTPASGARTYSVRAYKIGTGNGTVYTGIGGAGANIPAFIRITKV